MKIVALVKECDELQRGFEIENNHIPDQYIDRVLNDWDEYALEAAVQIGDEIDDSEIVAVTVGPFYAVSTVKRALAHGADRGIRIWDDELEERHYHDPRVTATILSRVIQREEPELVIAGTQSQDLSHGATGVLAAEAIDYNWVAVVEELDLRDGVVEAEREIEDGLVETIQAQLPAVITVQSGINDPRYVSMRSVQRNRSSGEITSLNLDDLGLDRADIRPEIGIVDMQKPKQAVETDYLDGAVNEEVGQLIDVLRKEDVVP